MNNIFKSKDPGRAATQSADPLEDLAAARIDAARRLSDAVREAGQAMSDLMDAERAFNAEVVSSRGASGNGAMRFAQQLYPFLVAEMNLHAPLLAKFLRVPHLAPSRCESVASMVERIARSDVESLSKREEAA